MVEDEEEEADDINEDEVGDDIQVVDHHEGEGVMLEEAQEYDQTDDLDIQEEVPVERAGRDKKLSKDSCN